MIRRTRSGSSRAPDPRGAQAGLQRANARRWIRRSRSRSSRRCSRLWIMEWCNCRRPAGACRLIVIEQKMGAKVLAVAVSNYDNNQHAENEKRAGAVSLGRHRDLRGADDDEVRSLGTCLKVGACWQAMGSAGRWPAMESMRAGPALSRNRLQAGSYPRSPASLGSGTGRKSR